MTVEDARKAQWCYEMAVYATAVRRKEAVEPAPASVESVAFQVPAGFDYNDFLAAVNEELRRHKLELHAKACLPIACAAAGPVGRIVRVTDM